MVENETAKLIIYYRNIIIVTHDRAKNPWDYDKRVSFHSETVKFWNGQRKRRINTYY